MFDAAEILKMSFAELEDHPRKHSLMKTAFTIQIAKEHFKEIRDAQAKQQAEVNG